MMIKQLCYLFSKIKGDEEIIVKLRDEWSCSINRTDFIKADNDVLTIFRANGKITVINPDQIIMAYTRKKGEIL